MVDRIRTTSTSRASADAEPVVLRETSTTRLLFCPTIVDNPSDPDAAVRGTFLFQRKKPTGAWEDYKDFPLSKLKDGEWIKLELHAGEVLQLYPELGALYNIADQYGVPRGEREFAEVGANVRALFQEPAIVQGLLTQEGSVVAGAFIRWLASHPNTASQRLIDELSARDLATFDTLLAAARLRQFNDEFRARLDEPSEPFWQDFFTRNSWVLARVFAHPFVLIQGQAYVGGKTIENVGGNLADFLYANKLTGNVLIVEIKTPRTRLLGPEYRNRVYPLSPDVSGAIAQVLNNRWSLIEDYRRLRGEGDAWAAFSPRCLVVAGNLDREAMSEAQRSSFELARNHLRDVELVTYDEFAENVDALVELLAADEG